MAILSPYGPQVNAPRKGLMSKWPFVTPVGFVAFGVLVPLAITSSHAMIRRLGARAWQNLRRCASGWRMWDGRPSQQILRISRQRRAVETAASPRLTATIS